MTLLILKAPEVLYAAKLKKKKVYYGTKAVITRYYKLRGVVKTTKFIISNSGG